MNIRLNMLKQVGGKYSDSRGPIIFLILLNEGNSYFNFLLKMIKHDHDTEPFKL